MAHILLKTALIASGAIILIAAGPRADLNQDGQVTKAEFTEAAKSHFLAADANNDSFLSEEERQSFRETKKDEKQGRRFDKLDTNSDGNITRDEMNALGEKRKAERSEFKEKFMTRYDTNLDGQLSETERTVMKAERDAKGESRKEAHKNRDEGKRGLRGQRPNPDANGDGLVSLDEHMAISKQLFTRLDANSDGVLTKGEGLSRKGKRGDRRGR